MLRAMEETVLDVAQTLAGSRVPRVPLSSGRSSSEFQFLQTTIAQNKGIGWHFRI
uniref:Uncharacterized protein n=1 Tax=Kalanchoe fedtschenkoi TaxID=63787 RepID=A0A7N0TV96_KALFE